MLDENGNPIEEDKTTVTDTDEDEAEKVRSEAKAKADSEDKSKDKDKKTSDEAAKLLKEVMALKAKLKEKDGALKEVNDKYKDLDLEEVTKLLKEREEAETKDLERKGEYERLLAKQKEKAEALIESERKQREEMQAKLAEAMKAVDELSLGNAFANSKFIQEKLALTPNKTRALYSSHFEIEEGKLVAYDKPKGAHGRTPLIDASGESLAFEDAIAEIINNDPDKEYLIKADLRQGAGSKSTNKIDPTKGNKNLDPISKIAEGLKNDKNFGPPTLL